MGFSIYTSMFLLTFIALLENKKNVQGRYLLNYDCSTEKCHISNPNWLPITFLSLIQLFWQIYVNKTYPTLFLCVCVCCFFFTFCIVHGNNILNSYLNPKCVGITKNLLGIAVDLMRLRRELNPRPCAPQGSDFANRATNAAITWRIPFRLLQFCQLLDPTKNVHSANLFTAIRAATNFTVQASFCPL